ncbi:MAG: hypothetical protein KJ714_02740 [Euryarchaeota archaeon]|nr:hypothetical protein [Euryarchaeota archaeon]
MQRLHRRKKRYDVFDNLKKLKDELESLIETIEITNNETLMEGIKRSRGDVKAGRVYELKNVDELDDVWA